MKINRHKRWCWVILLILILNLLAVGESFAYFDPNHLKNRLYKEMGKFRKGTYEMKSMMTKMLNRREDILKDFNIDLDEANADIDSVLRGRDSGETERAETE